MTDALIQPPPLELTWARFGDVVNASNIAGPEPHFVMHACDAPAPGFFCDSCDVHLANRYQLEVHVEKGGAHHVARWCQRHRVYEEGAA